MASTNKSLPDRMKNRIEKRVQTGCYANSSDYMRDVVRKNHEKLAELRKALIEGENSGLPIGLNIEAFITRKKKSLNHV